MSFVKKSLAWVAAIAVTLLASAQTSVAAVDLTAITAGIAEGKTAAETVGGLVLGIFIVLMIYGFVKMVLSKKGG